MKINGYTLQEPPFKGGMALVYKGVNANGFERAFKFVRPDKAENSPRLCQQFIKEIQLQSKLNHPNIIRILDAFSHTDDTGKAFTVLEMEWLNGLDLERYVKQKAKNGMNDETVKKVLLQTLDGLEYAHQHNVLHLDIKPSNLFRTFDGYVKIIDFGIARVVGDNAQIIDGAEKLTLVTETGESTFKGTMAYASPEQQVGGKLGFYSDIYSLGKTLHFLNEFIDCLTVPFVFRAQYGGGESRMMDSVGEVLRFKAHCRLHIVVASALANVLLYEVTGIDLHARAVGPYLHRARATFEDCGFLQR